MIKLTSFTLLFIGNGLLLLTFAKSVLECHFVPDPPSFYVAVGVSIQLYFMVVVPAIIINLGFKNSHG